MKKIVAIVTIFIIALVLTGCNTEGEANECDQNQYLVEDECVETFTNISNNTLVTMLDSPSNYQFVDVRTVQEYNNAHISGFEYNFDYYRFEKNTNLITGLDKDKPVVLMCNSGNRSVGAAAIFHELGFKEIYNLRDGIQGWNGETE